MVYGETVAAMADGSGLHIYGRIGLSGRLRNVPFEVKFLVCRISGNAILVMEFLSRLDCSVTCNKGLLVMGGKTIQCADWMGPDRGGGRPSQECITGNLSGPFDQMSSSSLTVA